MADQLGFSALVDSELSSISSRSTGSTIAYFPGSAAPEAWHISGRYAEAGNTLSVRVVIRHRHEVKHRLELSGNKQELPTLAKQVVEEVMKLVR